MQMPLRLRIVGITVMIAYLMAATIFALAYLGFGWPENGGGGFEDAVKGPAFIENPDQTPVPNTNNPPDPAEI